jgi:cytochrome c553
MKKVISVSVMALAVLVLTNCSNGKKVAAAPVVAKTNYTTDVQTIVMAKCSPCHIPAKGGNKLALDNYASVKNNIDDIIHRIELTPGTRGFMPFKGQKLSDAEINAFKKWKEDGLGEK